MELVTLDGITYVSISAGIEPVIPAGIELTELPADDPARELLKTEAPYFQLINQRIKEKIRERYDAEDEMYFARISVGALMGAYQMQPGEQQAVLAYGEYVESIRQWARDERAAVGL
jgi:hypothetical protein